MRFILLLSVLFIAPLYAHAETAATPQPIKSSDILPYLERVIGWSHAVTAADELMDTSREVVLVDKLNHDTQAVLQKSFAFAHAAEAIAGTEPVAVDVASNPKENEEQNRHDQLSKAAADADKKVADLQSQLNRPGLIDAPQEKLAGELKLAQARRSLLQTMLGIVTSESDATLLDQINALSRTVLVEPSNQSKSPVAEQLPAKSPQISYGIFGLSDALLALSRKKDAVEALLTRTQKITEVTRALMSSARVGLKDALSQGDALTANGDDAASLAAYRQSIDEVVEHYNQLSAVVIPLREINILLGNTQQNLQNWNGMIGQSEARLYHQLFIRILILALSIAIPLICSSFAHRAIYRLRDIQKRKQLDLTRRVLLIIVLFLAVLANFITEFGSLATFAGFLTAGLAVGLQTVLVSLVAHSLYFGRYGIHVGDRIRVTDVTGEVIQLGMLRLYMRELKETDKGLVPTGKIVAFPNSVLFQPAAFYRYADSHEIKNRSEEF